MEVVGLVHYHYLPSYPFSNLSFSSFVALISNYMPSPGRQRFSGVGGGGRIQTHGVPVGHLRKGPGRENIKDGQELLRGGQGRGGSLAALL